ncbi:MAG: S-methyl-5'-thioadenosine phosphorylase [Pseudomonadota bacterium]
MRKEENKGITLGIIGGSGIYELDGLTNTSRRRMESAFGEPSDEVFFGEMDGKRLAFLPRHGRGHRIPPSEVNYRANIDALKRAGARQILSLSAVGSLREDLSPGTFIIVDQFIDRTFLRTKSFFEKGMVAHVSMAHPVCWRLCGLIEASARDIGIPVVRGGTYLVMEGPQFSTLAESHWYRSLGCDVIGMTNMPEAKLAREAEICYATVGMVTDYDCWHPDHDNVTVEAVIRVLQENADRARQLVKKVVANLDESKEPCSHGCETALEHAVITAPESRDPEMIERLQAIAGRVLQRGR